jgi:CelD/BcsL family acetyltransferase involved in cellulose biosynthesis
MPALARVRLNMLHTTSTGLAARVVSSFDDPAVAPARWNALLARGHTESVNLTWEWQRNWWNTFGRGRLLLILIEQDDEPVCIAPLFAEHGMAVNICPEDRLDLVGAVMGPEVMEAIVELLQDCVPNFAGLRFYFIPEASPTGTYLEQAAERLGMTCFREAALPAPQLDLAAWPEAAVRCTRKKSLLRHEKYFRREGRLEVHHTSAAEQIRPQLDEFFAQHIARRAATSHPSLFIDPRQCDYYRSIVSNIGPTGWLRFTRVEWNGRPIAFHFGLSYRGRFVFGIPSFDIELKDHSPGEVLLRQVILAAIEEGARIFDFGPGGEGYKYRFATSDVDLITWGVYATRPPATMEAPR